MDSWSWNVVHSKWSWNGVRFHGFHPVPPLTISTSAYVVFDAIRVNRIAWSLESL
jgi:hypothetical protein